jgi:hypothetical protein
MIVKCKPHNSAAAPAGRHIRLARGRSYARAISGTKPAIAPPPAIIRDLFEEFGEIRFPGNDANMIHAVVAILRI